MKQSKIIILSAMLFWVMILPGAAMANSLLIGDLEKPIRLSRSFAPIIHEAADAYDIDPALIKAVIMAESRYNPKAISKRGARGLMQLMPATAKALGVADSFDPEDNIYGGSLYLRRLIDRFDGDVTLALAAYNAGSRHVRNYGGVPPFKQTILYINQVFRYRQLYREGS